MMQELKSSKAVCTTKFEKDCRASIHRSTWPHTSFSSRRLSRHWQPGSKLRTSWSAWRTIGGESYFSSHSLDGPPCCKFHPSLGNKFAHKSGWWNLLGTQLLQVLLPTYPWGREIHHVGAIVRGVITRLAWVCQETPYWSRVTFPTSAINRSQEWWSHLVSASNIFEDGSES